MTVVLTPLQGRGAIRRTSAVSKSVDIANDGTVSEAVEARGFIVLGAATPANLDWTSVSFEVSDDDATFLDLYDYTGAALVTMAIAPSRAYDLPGALCAWPFWRFKGDTPQAPATAITVVAKG